MAKRRTKELRARKQDAATRDDDSLLVQSAESLGRVIGSLQRQVQGSSKRVSAIADDAIAALPELPRFDDLFGGAGRSTRKRTAARKSSLRGAKATRKTAGARKRATRKTAGARKAPRARKTSGSRRRTGARKSSSSKR